MVFSTYQSIEVVSEAQKAGLGRFDLVVCDEAHRTTDGTGPKAGPSTIVMVHDNYVIDATRRIYMTATPRIYGDHTKAKAKQHEVVLSSMDDEATFGPVFHELPFGKAVADKVAHRLQGARVGGERRRCVRRVPTPVQRRRRW